MEERERSMRHNQKWKNMSSTQCVCVLASIHFLGVFLYTDKTMHTNLITTQDLLYIVTTRLTMHVGIMCQ